jgi:hypothetical protein
MVSLEGRDGAEGGALPGSPGGKLGVKCQVLRAEENDKKISSEYVDDNKGG